MFKRTLLGVFALVLLTGASVQAVTMVSVTSDNARLHGEAEEKSSVLWLLGTGFPLRVMEEQGDWLKVQDYVGDTGWIQTKQTARKPHMIVQADQVEIRSGPSNRFKLVGRANRGVVFQTMKVKSNWIKVMHQKGLTGWIARNQLWGW